MKTATFARRHTRLLLSALVGLLLVGGIAAQAATSTSAVTITAKPASLTTSTSATFQFTGGPKNAKYECRLDSAAYSKCSSPVNYNNLAAGPHIFSVRVLGTTAEASYSWTIDTVPPPAPVLGEKPTDPTFNATNFFTWTGPADAALYECSQDNGPWFTCTSRHTWVIPTENYGQRQFAVRSVDLAGNASAPASYSFKYQRKLPTEGLAFTINGSVSQLVIGNWQPVELTVTNPNGVTLFVNDLDVSVTNNPSGCDPTDNLEIEQSNVSPSSQLAVPAEGQVTLPAQGVSAPRIRLINLPAVNQDACKGVTFELSYAGTGTN